MKIGQLNCKFYFSSLIKEFSMLNYKNNTWIIVVLCLVLIFVGLYELGGFVKELTHLYVIFEG